VTQAQANQWTPDTRVYHAYASNADLDKFILGLWEYYKRKGERSGKDSETLFREWLDYVVNQLDALLPEEKLTLTEAFARSKAEK
ncbi:MAG: hypothetical protein NZM26_04725, partial [Patescibacteria group bacterium]|nr:hypothetical protein [Patescibacteria group bacterium]